MFYTASRMMKRVSFSFLVFILVILLLGCSENTPSSEDVSSTTGSIALNIVMGDSPVDMEGSAIPRAMSDECGTANQNQIWRVAATVFSTPNVSGFWECSGGPGTLANVNPGSNLRLVFIGYNATDFGNLTVYSGETQVNVVAGQTARPTIVAEVFSVDKSYPGEDAAGIDPVSITFQWEAVSGANGYVIEVADRADFSDPNIVVFFQEETANTSFTYDGTLEENTMYYWAVFPVDIAGDSAYGSVWSFTTGSGSTLTDDNYEENDTKETAFDLSDWDGLTLSQYNGNGVAVFDDYDYYRIEVPYTSATIEIVCTFSHASGDIDVELLDAGGTIAPGTEGEGETDTDDESITYVHSGSPQTTYFIKVWRYGEVDTNPNQYDLIWYAHPSTTLGANLTAHKSLENGSFSVSNDSLSWGQDLDIRWAVINDGLDTIPAGTDVSVSFYLSANNLITQLDYELFTVTLNPLFLDGLSSGSSIYGTVIVTLPNMGVVPESIVYYIGMLIDPYNGLTETNEYDNSNQGEGLDLVPVNINP